MNFLDLSELTGEISEYLECSREGQDEKAQQKISHGQIGDQNVSGFPQIVIG